MTQPITEPFRWTTRDLELLPVTSDRYEIIDGELFWLCRKKSSEMVG